jgi:hypothetical protein
MTSANDVRREPVAAINGFRTRDHRARRADVRRHFVNLTVQSPDRPSRTNERNNPAIGRLLHRSTAPNWRGSTGRFCYRLQQQATRLYPAATFRMASAPGICVDAAFATIQSDLILARLVRRYDFEAIAPNHVNPVAWLTTRPAKQIIMRMRLRRCGLQAAAVFCLTIGRVPTVPAARRGCRPGSRAG